MASTLPLDYETWDLKLDAAGNWTATDVRGVFLPQSVANAWLLFVNDSYLFPREGVPHKEDILGQKYPKALLVEHLKRRAMEVPGVVRCQILDVGYDPKSRTAYATGIVYDQDGVSHNVSIG